MTARGKLSICEHELNTVAVTVVLEMNYVVKI